MKMWNLKAASIRGAILMCLCGTAVSANPEGTINIVGTTWPARASVKVKDLNIARGMHGIVGPIGPHSEKLCRLLKEHFDHAGPISTRPCEFPIPLAIKVERPDWKLLNPHEHMPLIKEWAFWSFWKHRGVYSTDKNLPVDQLGLFIKNIKAKWHIPPRQTPMEDALRQSEETREIIEEGWEIYGDNIEKLIASGHFSIAVARIDLNGDGRIDTIYKLPNLFYGSWTHPIADKPQVPICQSPAGTGDSSELYVAADDDVVLHATLYGGSTLSSYDTFLFDGKRFVSSRSFDGELGVLSEAESSTYLPHKELPAKTSLSLRQICEFQLGGK